MSDSTGLGILSNFTFIFAFLLLFVISYGLLKKTQPLGENDGLYSLVSIVIGLIGIVSPGSRYVILYMAPWFASGVLIIFFIIFLAMIFGAKDDIFEGKEIKGIVMTVSLILLIFAIVGYQSQPMEMNEEGEIIEDNSTTEIGEAFSEARDIIIHPQVLGMILLLLTAVFAVLLMAKES